MKQKNKQEQVKLQKSMEQGQEELKIKQQIQVLDKVKKTMYSRINEFNKEEQELIKHLDNLEQQKKENYKNHLEGFDEEFETHTKQRINETPLLMNLFQEFVQQIYKPSNLYNIARDAKAKISEELEHSLDKEQKYLLKQLEFCRSRMEDDMTEQAFIFGYAMSCQLREEAIKQYPYKNE